jgi:2Fe-2S ferredoxin
MSKITFLPENKSGEVPEGTTLLEAAEILDVALNHECGGVASCSTCRIRLAEGYSMADTLSEIDVDEREVLEREQLGGSYRLACQARVKKDLTVVIPPPVRPLADQALPTSH